MLISGEADGNADYTQAVLRGRYTIKQTTLTEKVISVTVTHLTRHTNCRNEGLIYATTTEGGTILIVLPASLTWDLQAEVTLATNIGNRWCSPPPGDAFLHPALTRYLHCECTPYTHTHKFLTLLNQVNRNTD